MMYYIKETYWNRAGGTSSQDYEVATLDLALAKARESLDSERTIEVRIVTNNPMPI